MIRSEGSSPYEYARESGEYDVEKILEAAEMVGNAREDELLEKVKKLLKSDYPPPKEVAFRWIYGFAIAISFIERQSQNNMTTC